MTASEGIRLTSSACCWTSTWRRAPTKLAALAAVTIDLRTGELMKVATAEGCFLAMLNGSGKALGGSVLKQELLGKG